MGYLIYFKVGIFHHSTVFTSSEWTRKHQRRYSMLRWVNIIAISIMERNITTAQTVFRSSVVWVGILLNCVVLIAVSFSRQLHNPRHIFWAAVSIWECVLLFDCGIELVAVGRSSQSQLFCLSVCRFFISQWLFNFAYLPGVGRLRSLHFNRALRMVTVRIT